MWSRRANESIIGWEDSDSTSIVCGEHDGYARLPVPVTHRRKLTLDKEQHVLEVVDIIESEGTHEVSRHLHLAPDCHVEVISELEVRIVRDGVVLIIESDAAVSVIDASESDFVGWTSDGYHKKRASSCLAVRNRTDGNTELRLSLRLAD